MRSGWHVAGQIRISIWIASVLSPAAPPQFVGSKACSACHPGIASRQSKSAHAQALFRAPEHPLFAIFPESKTLARKPGYRFQVSRQEGGLRVQIRDSQDRMELPLDWAFGAGRQAVTFVTRVDRDWYIEHFASFYPALNAWSATPGQDAIRPARIADAAGVLYKVVDPQTGIAACFECHSTGPVRFNSEGEVAIGEAGVRCESCHGAGAAHAARPASSPLTNPAQMSSARLNDFCGRCHRPPAANGAAIDWNYAWNVRHQPVYLNQSACFQKSGTLSCLSCHDPHEPAEKKPAGFYNERCHGCHSTKANPPHATCGANCIDCHMPRVSPQPPLRFTNHWIGVYRTGSMLRPVRPR